MTIVSTYAYVMKMYTLTSWVESQVLWCNVHNVWVGVRMIELVALQLVQPVGARFVVGGPTNQEVGAPPPPGFPHTMLSVKKVKDNMQQAFIEKLFTNCEIGTNVLTRYLSFTGMLYESENYLCDTRCVQLRKVLARFRCGNTQLEVVLGAWKGIPYAKRLCWGYDLGKVEDEKHLLLLCPNTQKVRECFCLTLPFTHTSTLVELMQTTNIVTMAKFVACYQYQKTICFP